MQWLWRPSTQNEFHMEHRLCNLGQGKRSTLRVLICKMGTKHTSWNRVITLFAFCLLPIAEGGNAISTLQIQQITSF